MDFNGDQQVEGPNCSFKGLPADMNILDDMGVSKLTHLMKWTNPLRQFCLFPLDILTENQTKGRKKYFGKVMLLSGLNIQT